MLNGTDFEWHSKPQQNASHFEFYQTKTKFIKRLDFACVSNLNVVFEPPLYVQCFVVYLERSEYWANSASIWC